MSSGFSLADAMKVLASIKKAKQQGDYSGRYAIEGLYSRADMAYKKTVYTTTAEKYSVQAVIAQMEVIAFH
jgi:hypothetical protein